MIEAQSGSLAVDIPGDTIAVEAALAAKETLKNLRSG